MESDASGTADIDVELVGRMARGDQRAVADFYDRHAKTLMAVATRILNDRAAAEDVVQEAFVQIWRKASTYDASLGQPLGWAVVMTRNRSIDRLRKRQRGNRMNERMAAENPDRSIQHPESADTDRGEHLHGALASLPSEQRLAIEMAFFEGLSQTEIAGQLQQPLGTIKARIRRGMLRLREKLKRVL